MVVCQICFLLCEYGIDCLDCDTDKSIAGKTQLTSVGPLNGTSLHKQHADGLSLSPCICREADSMMIARTAYSSIPGWANLVCCCAILSGEVGTTGRCALIAQCCICICVRLWVLALTDHVESLILVGAYLVVNCGTLLWQSYFWLHS